MPESMMTFEEVRRTVEKVRGAVARGWCYEVNSAKEMDSDLAEAITQEIMDLLAKEES